MTSERKNESEQVCDTLPLDAQLYTEIDDSSFAPSDVYTHKEMD